MLYSFVCWQLKTVFDFWTLSLNVFLWRYRRTDWMMCKRSSKPRRPILSADWEVSLKNSVRAAGLFKTLSPIDQYGLWHWLSSTSFSQFLSLANKDQNQLGRTKLDKERLKLCLSEVVCQSKCSYFSFFYYLLIVNVGAVFLNAGLFLGLGDHQPTS